MTTATLPRKTRKPAPRSVALLVPPMDTGKNAVIRITSGKLVVTYFADRDGDSFVLTKVGAEEDVYVTDPVAGTCTCPGQCRWARVCKHIAGLRALQSRGKL